MDGWNKSLSWVVACAILALGLASCSGDDSDGGETPPAPASGSVTVTGTVSGTVINVVRTDSDTVIATADTAPLVAPSSQFPFTLSNIPVGVPIKIFFFSAGETFPLYMGATNVFTALSAGSIDLGFVSMVGGKAIPTNQPPVDMIQPGPEDPSPPPQNAIPKPATLTVATPAPTTGSVIVDFGVQNFVIGGVGQPHLHIRVDSGETRHFFNGQINTVLDDSNLPTTDVVHQTPTSFRLNDLAEGQHQVTVKLATASEIEFANLEANPLAVTFTINPPVPVPTLTITSPSPGASLPSGDIDVSFTVQNFTIGSLSASHLHIYLDGGIANHFYNGTNNAVLDLDFQPVANITWLSISSFRITGLSSGPHTIRLVLSDSAHEDLLNAEANPPILNFSIQAPAM